MKFNVVRMYRSFLTVFGYLDIFIRDKSLNRSFYGLISDRSYFWVFFFICLNVASKLSFFRVQKKKLEKKVYSLRLTPYHLLNLMIY